jgi:hypothetical protein
MATPTLKWALRIGAPKTTGDTMFSDNEGPNPNANDTPTCFTIKHYKWLLQYQQLFQFYLVHGHSNVIRRNANNSLAEWASYQRSKMGAVDKYDQKWKHLLNGIGFCSSPPSTPNQVFENHLVSYNVLRNPEYNHSQEIRRQGPPWVVEILATARKAIFAGGAQQNQRPRFAKNIQFIFCRQIQQYFI